MVVFQRYFLPAILAAVTVAAGAADVPERTVPAARIDGALVVASVSRGRMLYENHCTTCHDSVVHVRKNRRVKSVADLNAWVRRWAGELKLPWTDEEVDDVAEFLAHRFYKFDCRIDEC